MKQILFFLISVLLLTACETTKHVSHRTCIECDSLSKDSVIVYTVAGNYYYATKCPYITPMNDLVPNLTRLEVQSGKIIIHNNEMIGNTVTLYTSLPVEVHNTNFNIHLIGYCRYDSADNIYKSVVSISPFRYYRDDWTPPFKFDEIGAIQLHDAIQDSIKKSIELIPKYYQSGIIKVAKQHTVALSGQPLILTDSVWVHRYYKVVLNDTIEISQDEYIQRK